MTPILNADHQLSCSTLDWHNVAVTHSAPQSPFELVLLVLDPLGLSVAEEVCYAPAEVVVNAAHVARRGHNGAHVCVTILHAFFNLGGVHPDHSHEQVPDGLCSYSTTTHHVYLSHVDMHTDVNKHGRPPHDCTENTHFMRCAVDSQPHYTTLTKVSIFKNSEEIRIEITLLGSENQQTHTT